MLVLSHLLLLAVALGLFIPSAVLSIECLAACFSSHSSRDRSETSPAQVAVLMPAHNEAAGIEAALQTILPQVRTLQDILVVADNCTDETAAIARRSGVRVIERQDTQRRGKGYALDYGVRFLAAHPPEAIVLIDADCRVHPGTIDRLARAALAAQRPVQALYLMAAPAQPGTKDLVSALAFLVKNLVRPSGLAALGLPCLLTGTGMAFPWSILEQASLASGHIVEDMHLGIELALAGHPPLFCPGAEVTGILPQQGNAAKTQRTRWEHGHLKTLLTEVPRLLKGAIAQRRFDLLALALELAVPPLSLLIFLWGLGMSTALLLGILGSFWMPALILAIAGGFIFTAILSAWAKFGCAYIPASALLAIPFYLLWKIPLYLAFLIQPQTRWIRTERDT
jgi:cellulose synthase/poly-beta-1,6-N-acetylglucosamine synthase-like glycosyltransferase